MTASFQMWQTPEGNGGNYGLEAELQAPLQTLFSKPSLQAILEYQKEELSAIKQHYEELNTERKALLEDGITLALLEKCIAENETTRQCVLSAIHLLTVAKKAYHAMGLPWSRTIALRNGPIDIFSEQFMDAQINPFISELESIAPIGFIEGDSFQDKAMQNIMGYAIQQREKGIEIAAATIHCCNQFLQHRTSLNAVFAPQAYFRLRLHLSTLLGALQFILEDAHIRVVPLFHKNKFHADRTLPEFKAKIEASNIEERLQQNLERLVEQGKEIVAHEIGIQNLKSQIRSKSPLLMLSFFVPKLPLKNELAAANKLHASKSNPKTWARTSLK